MTNEPSFEFDIEKSRWLKEHRNISFEEVIALMDEGHILEVVEHPNKEKYEAVNSTVRPMFYLSCQRRLASRKVAIQLDASLRWHDKVGLLATV